MQRLWENCILGFYWKQLGVNREHAKMVPCGEAVGQEMLMYGTSQPHLAGEIMSGAPSCCLASPLAKQHLASQAPHTPTYFLNLCPREIHGTTYTGS